MKKYVRVSAIEVWLSEATLEMRKILSEKANFSTSMFRQWAAGRRGLSAELACRIAEATAEMVHEDPSAPAPILRGEMCSACRNCPHFLADIEESNVELIEMGSDVSRFTKGISRPKETLDLI